MFIPAEIHRAIFSYIGTIKEQLSWASLDKTSRNSVKILALNDPVMSHKIPQVFLNSIIMDHITILNIDRNTWITKINHLRDLKVLYCRHTKLSHKDLKGLKLDTLHFNGSKGITDLRGLTELKHVDTSLDDLGEATETKFETHCAMIIVSLLSFLLFLLFFGVTLIVFFAQLVPKITAQRTYIQSTAILTKNVTNNSCTRNLQCITTEFPEGMLCSNMTESGICKGSKLCIRTTKRVVCAQRRCWYIDECVEYIAEPNCTLSFVDCTIVAHVEYTYYDHLGHSRVISRETVLDDIPEYLVIYYDPDNTVNYMTSIEISTVYIANSLGLFITSVILFALFMATISYCFFSIHRIGHTYTKNYDVYQHLQIV